MIDPPPDYYGHALARAMRDGIPHPESCAVLSESIDATLSEFALLDGVATGEVIATIDAFLLDLEQRGQLPSPGAARG